MPAIAGRSKGCFILLLLLGLQVRALVKYSLSPPVYASPA